ncbi:MAG: Flp family type IVb pilin [Sandarakinorhabdus sp.]|nr:Flp family type IVb pilin [Sandarakinorhabdus sp.]
MRVLLVRLLSDRRGATAIEYGLIAAFIAVALVAALPTLRSNIGGLFSTVNEQVNQAPKK